MRGRALSDRGCCKAARQESLAILFCEKVRIRCVFEQVGLRDVAPVGWKLEGSPVRASNVGDQANK